ncbi:MAG: iron ABC transporter substrate-binding protein, partial [Alphaproteobacteria bacterium]
MGAAAIAATTFATGAAQAAEEVNVYSYRQPFLVEPLFEAFTKDTGVKVNVLFAETGLTERLVAEGANTPGDVILTVVIGRLNDVKAAGVTAP